MQRTSIRAAIALSISNRPEQIWPTYDRKVLDRSEFLSSSEVGFCLRSTAFAKQGYQGNHNSSFGYLERGHAVEAWIVKQLRLLQWRNICRLHYMGDDQRSFYDADLGLSGTPDGVIEWHDTKGVGGGNKLTLCEFKSIDPRTNVSRLPKSKHILQSIQNCLLIERCLGWQIDEFVVYYQDASDFSLGYDFCYPASKKQYDELIARAQLLWSGKPPNQFPAEGIRTGDCDFCPFTRECSEYISADKLVEVKRQTAANFSLPEDSELDEQLVVGEAARFLEIYEEHRQHEQKFEVEKERIKDVLVSTGVEQVAVSGKRVSVSLRPGRATIDKDKLEDAGLDPSEFEKVGKPYMQLDVKDVKNV